MIAPVTAPAHFPASRAYIDVVFMMLGIIATIGGGLLLVLKAWMVNKRYENEQRTSVPKPSDPTDTSRLQRSAVRL